MLSTVEDNQNEIKFDTSIPVKTVCDKEKVHFKRGPLQNTKLFTVGKCVKFILCIYRFNK